MSVFDTMIKFEIILIFASSSTVVESAGNEIRSMVSPPFWRRLPSNSFYISYWNGAPSFQSSKRNIRYYMDDPSSLFVLYKQYPSGGMIWLMLGLDTTGSDYDDILAIANYLAERGHEVKVLHAVHYKDPIYQEVFGELIGTKYYRKCPDLLIDGDYIEYESYTSEQPKNAFRNMLHNGLAQSDNIILRQCNLADGYMLRTILGYIQNGYPVSTVQIYDGTVVRTLYKTEG